MHAVALRIDLRIPGVRSLKGKRRVVRGIIARLSSAFPAAVAEVGHQDEWQRATIGVALVSGEAAHLEQVIGAVKRLVIEEPEAEVVEMGISWLEETP